jgi:hypothetical protein
MRPSRKASRSGGEFVRGAGWKKFLASPVVAQRRRRRIWRPARDKLRPFFASLRAKIPGRPMWLDLHLRSHATFPKSAYLRRGGAPPTTKNEESGSPCEVSVIRGRDNALDVDYRSAIDRFDRTDVQACGIDCENFGAMKTDGIRARGRAS